MVMKSLRILTFAGLLLAGSGTALAQDPEGPGVQFSLLEIEGLVVGTTMKIDAAYGAEHGVEVEAPFEFLVPTGDGLAIYVAPAEANNATLIKVTFATEDDQFVENVQFVPMTLGIGDKAERIATLADLLNKQAYPMAIAPYPQNKFIGWRATQISGYDAVEVLGEYIDPDNGHMFLRIVGYLNPDTEHSVIAIANISAAHTPIAEATDFPRTRSGVAMGRMKFIE